jgi:8-oxo-dGTP diphosphatase
MSGRHPGIPTGVHIVVERDGYLLLMRRAGTGFFDGQYSLPGGHVEADESLRRTAVRELAEETGLVASEDALAYLGVVHRRSDTNRIDFFFRADKWSGEPAILEPHKCDELVWADVAALPENAVDYVRQALRQGSSPWMFEHGW